jgi:hypothetical protein
MHKRGLRLVAVIAILCVCTAQAQFGAIKLASGKTVNVLNVGPLYFTRGGPPALMLRYQSELDFADTRALHKEALEIWKAFRIEVEQGHFQTAILSANAPPSGGLISRSQDYNFVFERQGHVWRETDRAAKL